MDIARLNYGVITLVPKVKEANNIKQFRPICLLNASFKFFTKLLMDRLTGAARKIISTSQSAFIKGRFIQDSTVILHEVMHEMKQQGEKGIVFKIDYEKAYDSINWKFVEEVLERKGFDQKLKNWTISTVRGGRVCININGENGPYFKTHRGLRQGDSLSPLLFNLAADALDHMFDKAKQAGLLKVVVPHLIQGGITHLQYADDTIILTGCEDKYIKVMKFLLYCFEWMSGLKINYHKSEVIVFGVEEEEQQRIANMLNCKIGKLPMTYLGIPISEKNLRLKDFTNMT